MVDDLGFSDLGSYGGEIETPILDRLAENGLRFREFYNTAKCAQSRASLLSGRYWPEVTFIGEEKNSLTVAEVLKAAGYTTLMSGKWHLQGEPVDQGFERYFGHLSGAVNFFTGVDTRGKMRWRLNADEFEVPETGFYATDAMTDYAIRFLDEMVEPDKPFFLYLAYNAPHYPLQAKQEDVEKYMGRYDEGWEPIRKARYANLIQLGLVDPDDPLPPRPDEVPAWETLDESTRAEHGLTMATFAGMVDCLDQNIGRLVDHLERMGRWENTLFIFLSDNGGCPFQRTREATRTEGYMPWDSRSFYTYDEGWAHVSNTPFRYFKQDQHEGGISTPLIVHWPVGIEQPGRLVHQPGHLVDIAPTLYSVAGAEYPQSDPGGQLGELRGLNLAPLFYGESSLGPRLLWQYFSKNRGLRYGDWKLSMLKEIGEWELYHIPSDRTETENLIHVYPEKARVLKELFHTLDADIQLGVTPINAVHGN